MKRNYVNKFITAGIVGLGIGHGTASGVDFEFEMVTGGDSNPNRLNEQYEIDPGIFAETTMTLRHRARGTGFYYKIGGSATTYISDEDVFSNPEFANEAEGDVELGFRWRPRFDYGRARFDFELYGEFRDGRYVRRSTGQLATFPSNLPVPLGTDITDRFDSSTAGFKTLGIIPISEEAEFVYDLYAEDKQYEEIVGTTLSILDYQQTEIDLGFEKRIWPRTNLITMIGGGFRFYEDRRLKDLNGDDVAGTDLEFTFLEIENAFEYSITDRWRWQLGMDIDQRKDNGEGYYDSTQGQLYTRFRYRNRDAVRFSLYLSYVTREFDNLDTGLPNIDDDDLREREGFRGKIELQRAIFERTRLNLDLIIGADVWSFENSNIDFTYDRSRYYVGINWHPF